MSLSILVSCGKSGKPALVVVIIIDQFRSDYLEKFSPYFVANNSFSQGGFRYFLDRGAWFVNAHQDHYPLFTAPGHAAILSGSPPYKSGIIGNEWFDPAKKRKRSSVEDCDVVLVGIDSKSCAASARSLRSSTLGDQMKLASGGKSKVWGLALKDRSAILPAGHMADGAVWFDEDSGSWISSAYFFPSGQLPEWLVTFNAKHLPDEEHGVLWEPAVPPAALLLTAGTNGEFSANKRGLGRSFPHQLKGKHGLDKEFYRAFAASPSGNLFTLRTALELIKNERLGKDEDPDLLSVSLSSNDLVGHIYGPDSPEMADITLRTDRMIADFLAKLDRDVGLQRTLVVLTADHGVLNNVVHLGKERLPAGTYNQKEICKAVINAMKRRFGEGDWVYGGMGALDVDPPTHSGCVEEFISLDTTLLRANGISSEVAEQTAADAVRRFPGIHSVYTRSQVLTGIVPDTDIARRVTRSFHPVTSPSIVYVPDQFFAGSEYAEGATHGSPFVYNTSVPLLFVGPGVKQGRRTERVSLFDLAPTLADILGVQVPSGSEGRILDIFEN